MAARHIVAPVHSGPLSLLVSVLSQRKRTPEIRLWIAAAGRRLDVCRRVAQLVENRSIPVVLIEAARDSPAQRAEALETALRDARQDDRADLCLDVSACSGEWAISSFLSAARNWRRLFLSASYESGRNATRLILNDPAGERTPMERDEKADMGDRDDCQPPITPDDFLGLFGLRVVAEDPYAVGDAESRLLIAAKGLLAAFVNTEEEYRRFRRALPREKGKDAMLDRALVPAGLEETVRALVGLGLLMEEATGYWFLGGTDSPAAFFLGGGWLELLVADVLARTHTDRAVARNVGTSWGRGNYLRTTYAEADAVFIWRNRIHVVSCKNEYVERRLFTHLDRFRSLVAEYGETCVRPILLSTEGLDKLARRRCQAYEIAVVDGRRLLGALAADADKEQPQFLWHAIQGAGSAAPGPGMEGLPDQ